MKKIKIYKSGWNRFAMLGGPFWYLYRGIVWKGILMIVICLATVGIGIPFIWVYCGYSGNRDYYMHIKRKNIYIMESKGR